MLNSNNIVVVISCGIMAWGVFAFVGWIVGGIRRLLSPAAAVDQQALDWEAVRRITASPVQLPDGTWQQAVFTWKPCDPPMLPNNLEVHNPKEPGHDHKNCKHCNAKPGYSGVSFRPN